MSMPEIVANVALADKLRNSHLSQKNNIRINKVCTDSLDKEITTRTHYWNSTAYRSPSIVMLVTPTLFGKVKRK